MRLEELVKVGVALTMSGFAAGCVAQTTSSAVITSCVSKVDGSSRIVAAPANCFTSLETVVQWNQAGPAFSTGPASASAGNVVYVPVDGVGASSGLFFVQAMTNLATLASATTPYEVMLGPGKYQLPSAGVFVPPFVSIRGAGMNTTILSGAALTFTDAKGQVENSFDMADLTITGSMTTIIVPDAGSITLDHVFTDGAVVMSNREADVAISISNSIFKAPLTVTAGTLGSHLTLVGTEVDVPGNLLGGQSLVCSGVYNASGALYGSGCQAPATAPTGP